jgi:UDP-3-O-[3-hydroxymyristoyl] glucosamine N-acyltransferase
MTYTLKELAATLGGQVYGDEAVIINRLATLQAAKKGELTFLANPAYRKQLPLTQASAVIVRQEDVTECPCSALVVENPYVAYATLSHLFLPTLWQVGIHPSAVIASTAQIASTASIASGVVIGERVVIENEAKVGSGCVIGDDSYIGEGSLLYANVSIYHGVRLGKRGIVHSGTVIGSDGFGFAKQQGKWLKIAQLGGVILGDDVEVGANVTIDRGALSDTVIEDGVKLDNQIQIAHNVRIGAHTAIAGCVGVAGSTTIGKYCTVGGGAGFVGHITVADHVHITGMTMVTKSILEPGIYSSGMAAVPEKQWKKNEARFRHLDELTKRVQKIEKIIKQDEA